MIHYRNRFRDEIEKVVTYSYEQQYKKNHDWIDGESEEFDTLRELNKAVDYIENNSRGWEVKIDLFKVIRTYDEDGYVVSEKKQPIDSIYIAPNDYDED